MNYITAEQFESLRATTADVFLKWWEENQTEEDLVINYRDKKRKVHCKNHFLYCKEMIPMLQLHQLWDFIEDEMDAKIDIEHVSADIGYGIELYTKKDENFIKRYNLKGELLQVLWEVAIKIAEEKNK